MGDSYERVTHLNTGQVEHRYHVHAGERVVAVVTQSPSAPTARTEADWSNVARMLIAPPYAMHEGILLGSIANIALGKHGSILAEISGYAMP